MLLWGSDCTKWQNCEDFQETLGGLMGKEESVQIQDVEEGEISDTASVEEITEEDFNKQESGDKVSSKESNRDSRVWTMSDLYKNYPTICRGYASGLYNLAWAQAVQNKPLNDIFIMEANSEEKSKRSSPSLSNGKEDIKNVIEVDKVVIEDSGDEMDCNIVIAEREEGELEEGEIDMDSELVQEVVESKDSTSESRDMNFSSSIIDSKQKELEIQVNSILETFESVTIDVAQKSFQEVCSRLHTSIETLELLLENYVPRRDTLIQRLYAALRIINSVFFSMSVDEKEENKQLLSRLLSYIKKCSPPLLSPEQIKSIDVKMPHTDSLDTLTSVSCNVELEIPGPNGTRKNDFDSEPINARHLTSLTTKLPSEAMHGAIMEKNNINLSLEGLQSGVSSSVKSKAALLPLLDLHKDHDADSLPSPTRETPPLFSIHKATTFGDGIGTAPLKMTFNMDASRSRPYETDALKAVSTYQQKFGRSSFSMVDRLPSPTPSEEFAGGDGDISEEVSSSSIVGNSKVLNSPMFVQSAGTESATMKGLISPINFAPPSYVSNPTVKPSAKSRDPRLRITNSDAGALDLNPRTLGQSASMVEPNITMNLQKQKIDREPNLDGPAYKKQRNGSQNPIIATSNKETVPGSGGWLEDTMPVGPKFSSRDKVEAAEADVMENINATNTSSTGNECVPITSVSNDSSLPLLKDIVVNPTMLINFLKMGQQQRLAAELKQKPNEHEQNAICPSSSNTSVGSAPLVNTSAVTPGILQKPSGTAITPSQMATMVDLGKVRMKPRDPRRILHGNPVQKFGSLGNGQLKGVVSTTSSTPGSKDFHNGHKGEAQGDLKSLSSQPAILPDIARQFTKNLKNIADIMSVSPPPTSSQSVPTKPVKLDKVDMNAVGSRSLDSKVVSSSAQAVDAAGPSRSQGSWGDLEHLFDGYDDKQKAAIQRERARRLEEQKKMFASRKLCLVLDLDHTLLNSAKFVEVDPVHDEILRKKEEQDREKLQRHLFRFPHMGMWTKLRPGVWNFLEKASELYELHLYTMGNKLYATEMAKVLDPKGVLFSGRVISRGDEGDPTDSDERVPKSKDLEGVLGMESAVVIIDDSVRVWPHNKLNLIVVERYTYFPCSRRQFGLLGPSLLEIDHDERHEDGTLASSLAVIQKIHQTFFSHPLLDEVDVRNILASEQQKILGGCRIVFSRVFPVGEANPHLHPLWQTAEQFGAVCTTQIDDQVTHVVANSLGTDKVNWALSTGRFVVHPGWVEASALLYRRANEQDFAIKTIT